MKIAQINMIPYGSTGNIMFQIAETAREHGHSACTYSTIPFDKKGRSISEAYLNHFWWGNISENRMHYYLGSLLGHNGCYSKHGTQELIKSLMTFQPDIIHLHNLHKFCINLPLLFRYLKDSQAHVIWTLHDCWAFTGHCPHFTMVECDRWKTGCHHCPQPRIYPKMYLDTSKKMYELKRKWFSGVQNMTLVTPSEWLANLVKQSFLKEYPVKVINNGIDLNVFKPTLSDFRKHYGIGRDKYILLGVAFGWGARKGLDVFIELSRRLNPDKYQIVLVGTDDVIDRQLPVNIISIHRTQNQVELAEIYTASDLFVNPTREEVLGMVNIESLACGTPVVTFKTGGSPETIDNTCGSVVDCDDIDAMEREIRRICVELPYSEEACLKKAQSFDKKAKFEEYVKLYEDSTHCTKCAL